MSSIFALALTGLISAALAAAVQERRVRSREWDSSFGMLTRAGVDARLRRLRGVDVLFLDIDGMGNLNASLGPDEVNRLVRLAFQLRRGDAILIGRWFSGDEIVVAVPRGDGQALATRLLARLRSFGLSATIAVESAETPEQAIDAAKARVYAAKQCGARGQVVPLLEVQYGQAA